MTVVGRIPARLASSNGEVDVRTSSIPRRRKPPFTTRASLLTIELYWVVGCTPTSPSVGAGPNAEDVVPDTIERALRYGDSYKPSAGTAGRVG